MKTHPKWVLGFEDEVWWSRLAKPSVHAWTDHDQALRLVDQSVPKEDTDPKALACYGMLMRWMADGQQKHEEMWLRFVDGRPVSAMTTAFLKWACDKLQVLGKEALLLIWDNASWHISKEVCRWARLHNRQVKTDGSGVRIVVCRLPSKSPWLNPIEPKWVHGKRRALEPDGLLTARQLERRVYDAFGCLYQEHLSIA